jgi:radical SAM-linked protein
MKSVIDTYKKQHLSVSLPSTRLEALEEEYLDVFKEEKKSGFTIAPEAGSQRLRNVINKNFTEEEVVETARMLFRNGWQTIKMYFMIGQPTETDADVIAIAELANTVVRKTSDIPGRRQVTVSVSNFVPKPQTPFQWHEQISADEIRRRQKLVKDHIFYKKQISFRSHAPDSTFVEGLFARSDRRYADIVELAYKNGAVFDCWQDKLDVNIWIDAATKISATYGVDLIEEAGRLRDLDERLPWQHIYAGIHPRFFKNEYQKAIYGIATEDCSFSSCHECGLCNEKTKVAPSIFKDPVQIEQRTLAPEDESSKTQVSTNFRFQHLKIDSARLLSTIDLKNLFVKAFKRAGILVEYDAGLRQRPKLSNGPALPLGVISRSELFDIYLKTDLSADDIVTKVNAFLPPELAILTGQALENGAPGITAILKNVSYKIIADDWKKWGFSPTDIATKVNDFLQADEVIVSKERKSKDGDKLASTINVRPTIDSMRLIDGDLAFSMVAKDGQPASPFLVLEALLGSERSHMARETAIYKSGFIRH